MKKIIILMFIVLVLNLILVYGFTQQQPTAIEHTLNDDFVQYTNTNIVHTLGDAVTPDTNFSIWTGSAWADAYDYYMDFRCTSTQTECEPDNQDIGTSQSIYRICNNGTGSGTTVQMMMNATIASIVLKCDDDYTYAGAITLSTSNQTIHGTLANGSCIDVSCWADYSNPSAGGFFDTYAYVI